MKGVLPGLFVHQVGNMLLAVAPISLISQGNKIDIISLRDLIREGKLRDRLSVFDSGFFVEFRRVAGQGKEGDPNNKNVTT
jgi:hypothetical protein